MVAKNSEENMGASRGPYMLAGFVCLIIFLAAISFVYLARSPSQSRPLVNSVSVTATGSVSQVPTTAVIYLYANGTGNSTAQAAANLSGTIGKLNSTILPYLNGNGSLIKTTYYNVQRAYSYVSYPMLPSPEPIVNKSNSTPVYVATEDISVTLPSLSSLNLALSSLASIPNVNIQDASAALSSSQISSLRQSALTLAVANATSQASGVIGNATVLWKNVTIQSSYFYPYAIGDLSSAASGSAQTTTAPKFFNGTDSVTETVYVTFYYKN